MFISHVLPGSRKVVKLDRSGAREFILKGCTPENCGVLWFRENGIYAVPEREAEIHERNEYYDKLELPRVYVFPVLRTRYWMCIPSIEHHYRRHVPYSAPLPLLFSPSLSVLEPVVARVYRGKRTYLFFENYHRKYDYGIVEEARSVLEEIKSKNIRDTSSVLDKLSVPRELKKALKLIADSMVPPLEKLVRYSLRLVGAELVSLKDWGKDLYKVEYRYKDRLDNVLIDSSLFVRDSGICLSGRDRDFDLASIVIVKHQFYEGLHENDYY